MVTCWTDRNDVPYEEILFGWLPHHPQTCFELKMHSLMLLSLLEDRKYYRCTICYMQSPNIRYILLVRKWTLQKYNNKENLKYKLLLTLIRIVGSIIREDVLNIGVCVIGLSVGVVSLGVDIGTVSTVKNRCLCYVFWEALLIIFIVVLPQNGSALSCNQKYKFTFCSRATYLENRIG